MYARPFIPFFLLFLPLAPAAAVLTPETEIVTATVFPDRAEVVRVMEVSLTEGQGTIVVGDLPANLISESVRVRGQGVGVVLIGSVETRRVFAEDVVGEEERRLGGKIESLRDEIRVLDDGIAATRIKLDFIKALGHEIPKTVNEEIGRGDIDPKSWSEAWSTVGQGADEALEEIRAADLAKRNIGRKIEQLQRQLAQVQTGRKASIEVHVNVEAPAPTKARLWLSYQLPGASWRPLYESRLDSQARVVRLTQIGEVSQRTGEDWTGVALTLSTARPGAGVVMPDLQTWFIDLLAQRPPIVREMTLQKSRVEATVETDYQNQLAAAPADQPRERAVARKANLVAAEFSAAYRIPGSVNVSADNSAHKFTIDEREIEARLAVRIVPKVTPRAYLYGEMILAGEEALLPGPVAVFRDDAFSGSSRISMVRPGEMIELSFGIDDKFRIEHRMVEGERSEEGLINKQQRHERRFVTKIVSHHAKPIEATLMERLPVPLDERIEVETPPDSTPATETHLDGRKGVLAWTYTYAPNEEREIRFAYAVNYPLGKTVPGF